MVRKLFGWQEKAKAPWEVVTSGSVDADAVRELKSNLRDEGMPLDHMSSTVQLFLGTRLVCAQCHNHPFDRWTMDDYYGFAALFAQVRKKRAEDPHEQIVFDGGGQLIAGPDRFRNRRRVNGETFKNLYYAVIGDPRGTFQ